MAVDIERKFLVVGNEWREHVQRSRRLVQGYLTPGRSPSASEAMDGREGPLADIPGAACSVRVRTDGEAAWLSVKSAVTGIERREYEYAIPLADAECMIEEFCAAVIRKIRHYVTCAGVMFEVDEFLGDNDGLVVAEIELQSIGEDFPRPAWLGREVSNLPRYYNFHLLQYPYSHWNARERAGD